MYTTLDFDKRKRGELCMRFTRTKLKINPSYIRTYSIILLPSLFMMIYGVFMIFSFNNTYKEILTTNYAQTLSVVYTRLEDTVKSTIQTTKLLSINDEFMHSLKNDSTEESIQTATEYMSNIKDSSSLIDDIFIIDSTRKNVFGTYDNASINEFFNIEYDYENYDLSYWSNYQSPFSEYKILPPSQVNKRGTKKTVTPIVFTKLNGIALTQLIVVNIDNTYLFDILEQNILTTNSRFLYINKLTRTAYEKNSKITVDEYFYKQLLNDTTATFEQNFDGKKSLIITYSPTSAILGYAYATVVPASDIISISAKNLSTLILVGLITILATLVLVRFSAKNIYTPVKKLAAMAGSDTFSDPIAELRNKIIEMQASNNDLKKEISDAVPLAQERKLLRFLHSDFKTNFESDLKIPDFKLPYFCVAIIKLCPTDKFYETFNATQSRIIYSRLYDIISEYFKEISGFTRIINCDSNTLYILINQKEQETENIENILNKTKNILKFDSNYINVYTSLGGVYTKIEDMRKSCQEALKTISGIITLGELQIHLENTNTQNTSMLLNPKDESVLTNMLLAGKTADAFAMIEDFTHNNMNISEFSVMQLNTQLLNIIFKVMRLKGISYDSKNQGDLSLMQDILTHTPNEVFDTIKKLLDELAKHMKGSDRVDIKTITDYVQNNFASDLYLDKVAETFGTSSKYLSRKFKESVGMNFSDYLSHLRLENAKILLASTDKPITQIMSECGFSNRTTFIRAFKNYTGDTPGNWRKNEKH